MRMLDEQKLVGDLALLALIHELLLDCERFGVTDAAADRAPRHLRIDRESVTELNASPTASYRVGCAWMVCIMVSTVASASIAATASEISSKPADR